MVGLHPRSDVFAFSVRKTRDSENGAGRRSRGPPTDIAAYRFSVAIHPPGLLVVRAVFASYLLSRTLVPFSEWRVKRPEHGRGFQIIGEPERPWMLLALRGNQYKVYSVLSLISRRLYWPTV